MRRFHSWLLPGLIVCAQAAAPDNLVVEGIPDIPEALASDVSRYLEFRTAAFQDWHPRQREMLITTRFADSAQLHRVSQPRGMRKQLTFLPEPVRAGRFQPQFGRCLVFERDTGGGEFYQLYRYDLDDGQITLLTDGRSRNTGLRWSPSGRWIAYTSTRRNGRDNDIFVQDPTQPTSVRLVREVKGGGWSVADWSPDEKLILVQEFLSINESHLHVVEVESGLSRRVTPGGPTKVAYGKAQFAGSANSIAVTSDQSSEYLRLGLLDTTTGEFVSLTSHIPWDVEDFDVCPGRKRVAFVTNEDGSSVLRLLNLSRGKELDLPKIPTGVISSLQWHPAGREIGFALSAAQSPGDAFSLDVKSGRLERWTESETGGLDPARFVQPRLIRFQSFDGVVISAFIYQPDSRKFPGPRPVVVSIHGGPESQSRPAFQARNNYYLNELGVVLVYPNVRGSRGYGKTFLTLDNAEKREDSVRDIGAVLERLRAEPGLDADRIAVMGGSYGGYMVLASMVHFNERIRCGIDIVGISNFVSFLRNTQDYRRDLRRAEYGDEQDETMRAVLERISPLNHAARIQKPLLVVQGQNDPRVPLAESEQMVNAIRGAGGQVWYVMARDEGHGFAKKRNADYQYLAMTLFLRQYLLQ